MPPKLSRLPPFLPPPLPPRPQSTRTDSEIALHTRIHLCRHICYYHLDRLNDGEAPGIHGGPKMKIIELIEVVNKEAPGFVDDFNGVPYSPEEVVAVIRYFVWKGPMCVSWEDGTVWLWGPWGIPRDRGDDEIFEMDVVT